VSGECNRVVICLSYVLYLENEDTPCVIIGGTGKTALDALRRDEMTGWVELGDGMAGFVVGLFLHAIPASWWPRWLGKLVGKVR
jgi:hypothetical protein